MKHEDYIKKLLVSDPDFKKRYRGIRLKRLFKNPIVEIKMWRTRTKRIKEVED